MATWNQNIGITNWQNRTNQQGGRLSLSPNVSSGSYNLSIVNGNTVVLPTQYQSFTVSTLQFIDTGTPGGLDQLYAYGGQLFLNGSNILISTISTSVLDWSKYPAISDVAIQNFNIRDVGFVSSATVNTDDLFFISSVGKKLVVSTVNGNTAFFSSLSNNDRIFTNRLWTNSISSGSISTGTLRSINGSISSLAVSSLTGSYADNVSTQLAVLSNFSTTTNPTAYSNWSLYPARSNVNFAGFSANSINTVNTGATNTNSLTVGNGGQLWNGNAQFNGTGNTFQPYWYNFTMDANITTANSGTKVCPTNTQYFSNWFVATNVLDIQSLFSQLAFTTTTLNAYTAYNLVAIPTGYINLRSHNYRSVPLFPPYTLKDYRGQLYLGTEGYGPTAYISINNDSFQSVDNVGTSILINADSVTGSIFAGFSRITSQSARNQMLATVQTQIYAGYLGVDPAYTYYAGFEQSLLNAEGGGATQTMRSRGADVLGFPGSRTDITSECPANTSVPSQMNIYSSQSGNLYTDGDFYIGYGGSAPRYGFNSADQKIHIVNANDIQGRTTGGLTITNINSVQGLNSNSFIQNIHYLVGYDTDVASGVNFLEVETPVRSTIDFKYSTIAFYSNIFLSSINETVTFSTLSSIVFAQSSYTSSLMLNTRDISTFKTNINSFNINSFNEILGISTILSSFIINVDRASIKQIDRVSSITANTGFFSNITNSNIINTNILTANTGNFTNITANTGNFINISTGTITPISLSTLNISTGIINAQLINVSSIVANNIFNNNLTTSNISTNSISTNNILTASLNTSSITTNTIDVKGTGIQLYKPNDQVNPVGVISGDNEYGIFINGENNPMFLQSFEAIGIATPLLLLAGSETVQILSSNVEIRKGTGQEYGSLTLGTLNSYSTNTIQISTASIYTSTLNTIQFSTDLINTSTITTNTIDVKGTGIQLYKPNDQVNPVGVISGDNTYGTFIDAGSNPIFLQSFEAVGIATPLLVLAGSETVQILSSNVEIRKGTGQEYGSLTLGTLNSYSTNTTQISTASIYFNNAIGTAISTNSISTGTINFGSASGNIINFNQVNTNLLSTGLIQSGELDVIVSGEYALGAGNIIVLSQNGTQIQDNASVDIIAQTQLTLTSIASDITIASGNNASITGSLLTLTGNQTDINSLSDINLNTINGYTNIGYASTGSIYTSTITTNAMDVKGTEEAFIKFYKPSDQEFPIGAIGGSDTVGFAFTAPSSIYMVAGQDININATSNLNLGGEYTIIGAISTILLTAPEINIPDNLTVSSIRTNQVSSFNVETQNLNVNLIKFDNLINQYVNNISGVDYMHIDAPLKTFNFNYISNTGGNNPGVVFQYSNLIDGSLTFNSSNRFVLSKPLDVSEITTDSLIVNNSVENSISSLRISTGNLFSGVISSIQFNASSINANRAFINNLTGSGSATTTTNLYPQSAGAQIGFFGSGGTNSGGFYNQINARSTLTQVIVPDIVGAFSNNIRIQGNLSTQNVFVSTINRKQYPTRSTIGGPFFPSSFTIDGSVSATPQLLISSINFYAGAGNYDISQRMAFIKLTGGTSVDAHGSILVASTNTLLVPDSNAGYGQVPQVNDVGHSTFTTMYTSITIGTNSFQRQYKYLDTTGGNYTGSLYLERPVITYIPSQGINPE